MTHLTDDQILALTRAGDPPAEWAAHAAKCPQCQRELAAWQAMARAARSADALITGTVRTPSFEQLVAPRLPASAGVAPVRSWSETLGTVGASLHRRVRLALALVGWQWHLLPRALAPLTLLGLAVALVAARSVPSTTWGERLFVMLVTLSVLAGAASISQPRRDPRRELLFAVPTQPGTVFLARLTLVLALDMAAAAVSSVALALAGHPTNLIDLILAWLGPSLLSASVAVVIAVSGPAWVGSTVGGVLWLAGSVATLPGVRHDVGVGAVLGRVWSTNLGTVSASVVLLALAVLIASRPMSTGRPDPHVA